MDGYNSENGSNARGGHTPYSMSRSAEQDLSNWAKVGVGVVRAAERLVVNVPGIRGSVRRTCWKLEDIFRGSPAPLVSQMRRCSDFDWFVKKFDRDARDFGNKLENVTHLYDMQSENYLKHTQATAMARKEFSELEQKLAVSRKEFEKFSDAPVGDVPYAQLDVNVRTMRGDLSVVDARILRGRLHETHDRGVLEEYTDAMVRFRVGYESSLVLRSMAADINELWKVLGITSDSAVKISKTLYDMRTVLGDVEDRAKIILRTEAVDIEWKHLHKVELPALSKGSTAGEVAA